MARAMFSLAGIVLAMSVIVLPGMSASAEPESVPRVVTIDSIESQTIRLMVTSQMIDEAGDFDGDGLFDVVFVADDLEYYLLYGQDGLSGKLLDGRALRTASESIRRTRFVVPSDTPSRLAVGGGGDVNGDGLDDIVLGAAEELACPEGCPRMYDRPVFYLVLGQEGGLPPVADLESLFAIGKAARLVPPQTWEDWVRVVGPDIVEFLGDMNGDKYGELAIGQKRVAIEGTEVCGGVLVLFGNSRLGGQEIDLVDVGRSVPGLMFAGTRDSEQIGEAKEGLGDIDGDGFDDLALVGGGGSGFRTRLYIIYGGKDREGQYRMDESLPSEWSALLPSMWKPGRLGDMNGDGYDDFTVAPSERLFYIVNGGQRLHGQVSAGDLRAQMAVSTIDNVHPVPDDPLYSLGDFHGGVDINADGIPDFCYGSGGAPEPEAGRSIVVLGRGEFSEFVSYDELLESYAIAIEGTKASQYLGSITLPLQDFDGDRVGDIIVFNRGGARGGVAVSYIVGWRSLVSKGLTLSSVDPTSGSRLGGDLVMLRGANFGTEMEVLFGDSEAEVVEVVSGASMVVRTPPHDVGTVDVSIERSGEWATLDLAFAFDDRYTRTVDLSRISRGDRSDGVELHFSAPETSILSGKLIRDINGDSKPELALLADPQDGSLDSSLYVILGGRSLPDYVDLSSTPEVWDIRIASSRELKMRGLLGSADMDGDGIGDVALRVRADMGKEELLLVVSGRMDFAKELVLDQMDRVTAVRGTEATCVAFWLEDAVVSPDLDGDGLDDILAADIEDSCGGGGGIILYGSPRFGMDPSLCVEEMVAVGEAARLAGVIRMVAPGDIDGNGWGEIGIEMQQDFSIALLDLRDGRLRGNIELTDDVLNGIPCRGYQLIEFPIFLSDLSIPGDLDGDGRSDLAVGTLFARQNAAVNSGAVNIISSAFTREGQCADIAFWTLYANEIVGDRPRTMLGWELERAGDWNGDGFDDLLVGAPGYHMGMFPDVEGAAYIIYGSSSIRTDDLRLYDLREKGMRFSGAKPGWWVGEMLSGGLDFNGDGLDDLTVTESSYPSGKETGASAYLIYGRLSEVFRRGDANGDGMVDLGDAVFALNYLFADGKRPSCLDSADIDDDGVLTIADPIYLLQYLFVEGLEPKPPFDEVGPDPTADGLFCSG